MNNRCEILVERVSNQRVTKYFCTYGFFYPFSRVTNLQSTHCSDTICNDPIHTELKSLCSRASPWIELAGTHSVIDVYQSTSASLLQRRIQSKINNKLHSSRLAIQYKYSGSKSK